MKQTLSSFLIALLLNMLGIEAFAHDIEVVNTDDVTIYYNFKNNSMELAVTYKGGAMDSYSDEYFGNVVIPDKVTYNGVEYTVSDIENFAFYDCLNLTSVDIPNTVTNIGQYAFSSDTGLRNVTLGSSVKTIGMSAFSGCSGLTSITIPNSVVSMGKNAFYGCSALKSAIIGNSVTSIEAWTFNDCRLLSDVTIGNSVTSIGGRAFGGCTSLTSIIIPDDVTSIDWQAFGGCTGLESAIIGKSVSLVGEGVFIGCDNLVTLIVDTNNAKYTSADGANAIIEKSTNTLVLGCKNTVIPNSVTVIGSFAFNYCTALKSIVIPNSVTTIDYQAFGSSGLESIIIPNSVSRIWMEAFYSCSDLTTITIGNGIKKIGDGAFSYCENVKDIYCLAEEVPITNENAFSYSGRATLHVPESSIDDYRNTKPWSLFSNFVPAFPTYNLTYMVDGEPYKNYKYEENKEIPIEPAPVKEGYTFSGWSEIPETMPGHDVEVTGTFTVNKYNLIYMVDGEEYKTVEIEYGAEITPEDGPEKEGYTFTGWSEIPETMPANDVTVTGIYEKNLLGKCATPTITYANDELTFSSETEDVEFVYDIKVNGSASGTGNKVKVATTLTVNVYAKKEGYENSDVATKEIQPKFGDLSGDGKVDATDITRLIEILLQ